MKVYALIEVINKELKIVDVFTVKELVVKKFKELKEKNEERKIEIKEYNII